MSNSRNIRKRPVRAKGKTAPGTHRPVLYREVIEQLAPEQGAIIADCTLGYGGHARRFMEKIGPSGRLVGFDVDAGEQAKTIHRLSKFGERLIAVNRNFRELAAVQNELGIEGFDIIFADLGISSMQVDDASRGISYKADGPLDMRMDKSLPKTGADILAEYNEEELARIFDEYSDEPDSELIAKWIAGQRQAKPIETVNELLRLVLNAKGFTERTWKKEQKQQRFGATHPAARVFQAVRIEVNDELGALRRLLEDAPVCLKSGGRLGIISFHSGEENIVRRSFSNLLEEGVYSSISENSIRPTSGEVARNPRSSSARFRIAIKK
jgi:16S rRNA (cytosine1402-N4)-methyltransferase